MVGPNFLKYGNRPKSGIFEAKSEIFEAKRTKPNPRTQKNKLKNTKNRGIFEEPARSGTPELKIHQKSIKNPLKINQKSLFLLLIIMNFTTKNRDLLY